MTNTTYSLVFDMSRGRTVRGPLFELVYNGVAIGEHSCSEAANRVADDIAKRWNTARECFVVREKR